MGLFVRLFEVSGCDVMMLDGFIEVMEDWCVYFRQYGVVFSDYSYCDLGIIIFDYDCVVLIFDVLVVGWVIVEEMVFFCWYFFIDQVRMVSEDGLMMIVYLVVYCNYDIVVFY